MAAEERRKRKQDREKEIRVEKRDSQHHPDPYQSGLQPSPRAPPLSPPTLRQQHLEAIRATARESAAARGPCWDLREHKAGSFVFPSVFIRKIIQQKRTEVQQAAGASPRLRALWEHHGICWKGRHHVDIGSVPSLLSVHVPPDRLTVPQRLMSSTLGLWGISDMLGQWHHSDGSRSSFPPSISDLRRRTNNKISHSVGLNSLLNWCFGFLGFFCCCK